MYTEDIEFVDEKNDKIMELNWERREFEKKINDVEKALIRGVINQKTYKKLLEKYEIEHGNVCSRIYHEKNSIVELLKKLGKDKK